VDTTTAVTRKKEISMPPTLEATELNLDTLIDDLDARITESDLPEASADSGNCSAVCTIVICGTVVIC
jgi:hypothetical protein